MVLGALIFGLSAAAADTQKTSRPVDVKYEAYHSKADHRAPAAAKSKPARGTAEADAGKDVVTVTIKGDAAKKLDQFINGRLGCCGYTHHPENQFSGNVGPNISCTRSDEGKNGFGTVVCSVSFDATGTAQKDAEYDELDDSRHARDWDKTK